jgi:hypothetical protein
MNVEEKKASINDKIMDEWIRNYINNLPNNWNTELDMKIAVKNGMIEALSKVELYCKNHQLSQQLKSKDERIKELEEILDSNDYISFIRKSRTNAEVRRYWRNKLLKTK